MKKRSTWLIPALSMHLAMALWGGSWISAKLVSHLDPMSLVAVRLLLTGITIIPVLFMVRETFPIGRRWLWWTLLAAACLLAYNYLFFSGLRLGPAGQAGVLVTSTNPLWAFALSHLFYRQRWTRHELAGLALGLSGGLLQVIMPLFDGASMTAPQAGLFLLAAGLYALMTLAGQKAQSGAGPLLFTASVHILSGAAAFLILVAGGGSILPLLVLQADSITVWANVLYMAVGAGTIATTIYFMSARSIGAAKTSVHTFLVPVWAVILSFLVLGEIPPWYSILGGVLALGSVALVSHRPHQGPADPPQTA